MPSRKSINKSGILKIKMVFIIKSWEVGKLDQDFWKHLRNLSKIKYKMSNKLTKLNKN